MFFSFYLLLRNLKRLSSTAVIYQISGMCLIELWRPTYLNIVEFPPRKSCGDSKLFLWLPFLLDDNVLTNHKWNFRGMKCSYYIWRKKLVSGSSDLKCSVASAVSHSHWWDRRGILTVGFMILIEFLYWICLGFRSEVAQISWCHIISVLLYLQFLWVSLKVGSKTGYRKNLRVIFRSWTKINVIVYLRWLSLSTWCRKSCATLGWALMAASSWLGAELGKACDCSGHSHLRWSGAGGGEWV